MPRTFGFAFVSAAGCDGATGAGAGRLDTAARCSGTATTASTRWDGTRNVPSGPAVSIRAANANRIAVTVYNPGPGPLEVALTAAAFNTTGIRIPCGQSHTFRSYRGELFGVSNSVGTRAKVQEYVE